MMDLEAGITVILLLCECVVNCLLYVGEGECSVFFVESGRKSEVALRPLYLCGCYFFMTNLPRERSGLTKPRSMA